jgi:hypothetical protein
MVEATIEYSAEYLTDALRHYHRQGVMRHYFLAVKVLGLAFFIPQAWLLWQKGLYVSAALSAGMVFFFFYMYRFVCWMAQWNFQRRPYYGQRLAVRLSTEGFYGRSKEWEIKLPWSAFQRVVHFRDGFLLFQGSKVFNWVPVAALKNTAQVSELEALLRAQVKAHHVIAPCGQ